MSTFAVWDSAPLYAHDNGSRLSRPEASRIGAREIRAAERGKARAASAHYRDLQLAREVARELGLRVGPDGQRLAVCADDIRRVLAERFPDFGPVAESGRKRNWMGACFLGGEWSFVGYTKSTAVGSHGNLLRTWRLK